MSYEYLAVGENTYYSKECNRLFTVSGLRSPYKVYYPSFLDMPKSGNMDGFSFDNGGIKKEYSSVEKCDCMDMVTWQLKVDDTLQHKVWQLDFYDTEAGKWNRVVYNMIYEWGSKSNDLMYHLNLIVNSGKMSRIDRVIRNPSLRMRALPGCQAKKLAKPNQGVLKVGLCNSMYHLTMNGRMMNGVCYAFVCEVFAFILKDDLSIDAICMIDATASKPSSFSSDMFSPDYKEGRVLNISDIIWTRNPYILKFKLLAR